MTNQLTLFTDPKQNSPHTKITWTTPPMMELVLRKWEMPSHYFGFNPEGDYVLLMRHRDSSILDNSDFEVLRQVLTETAKNLPPIDDEAPRDQWVYTFTVSCWARGWREYLMIRYETTENSLYRELLHTANSAITLLDEVYPILDEDHYTKMQDAAICKYWEEMSISDRVHYCQEAACNIFTARHNSIPQAVFDHFYESGEFE